MSCYIPPGVVMAHFEDVINRMNQTMQGERILVGGDFNAKSLHWGSRVTNSRGEADWAAELGLIMRNVGAEATCVRHNRASIVDLT